jgi:hypothetical protein
MKQEVFMKPQALMQQSTMQQPTSMKQPISMQQPATHVDVKNLCSRKLWELAESRSVDSRALYAIAEELQLRRHYLNELEQLLPPLKSQQH